MDDKTLLTLMDKFAAGDIAELELSDGSVNLRLRKASAANAPTTTVPAPAGAGPQPVRADGCMGRKAHQNQKRYCDQTTSANQCSKGAGDHTGTEDDDQLCEIHSLPRIPFRQYRCLKQIN